ncbi:hypothetical protein CC80DRAFT_480755 [Byssothecium circinans]|uniref:Uncharacterized protein n=1 Tax=Byssothecium circinans TaxID=147558 RepID=A0A6A5TIJ1_9PLEO|nr:hypothetical protein CC80DRAFT_480755 [Byssothecium circinans]
MRSTFAYASLLGANATASTVEPHYLPRGTEPKFRVVAHGHVTGIVGQLNDGQLRIGGKHPVVDFQWEGDRLVNGKGRGCIITPPNTTQWQCDAGVKGESSFEIGCGNKFLYHGSPDFWACPVNDHGEWNIYRKPDFGQKKCTPITLTVTGNFPPKNDCKDGKPAPPPPSKHTDLPTRPDASGKCGPTPCQNDKPKDSCKKPEPPKPAPCGDSKSKDSCAKPATPKPEPPKPTKPAPPHPEPTRLPPCYDSSDDEDDCHKTPSCPKTPSCRKHCPLDLAGPYEFPHLIVPVDSARPEEHIGNQLFALFTETICTVFNFDVHHSLAGKTCSLHWLFPTKEKLETSDYNYRLMGEKPEMTIARLHKTAGHDTTFKTLGDAVQIATGPVKPDVSWTAHTEKCLAGQRVSYLLCGKGFKLKYFEDFNPSPIGLFMRAC